MTPSEIIDVREKRGWNQQALAEHVGVGQPTVSRWETDKAKPRGAALKILKALSQSDSAGNE